ncbi:MAG: AAA family ATPase [Leptospirillia bacterium]
MRLDRLDLLAYGPFHHRTLTLGPGFHLIYGPNEAGKSTTLRAVSSLLFGFPRTLEDHFRFDAADLLIGGEVVAADGSRLSFLRKRRGKGAFVDGTGTPLDPQALSPFTGGMDREEFERLFSLNGVRLREFALSLLADGGGLGTGLVEAGAGIVGLRKRIEALSAEREELFTARGRTKILNTLLARYGDLRKAARDRMLSPAEYKRLEAERRRLKGEVDRLRREQAEVGQEIRTGETILRILPKKARYRALMERLESLSTVPLLPQEAFDRRIRAESDLRAASEEVIRLDKSMADLLEKKRLSPVEESLALLEKDLEPLEGRRGAIAQSQSELPRRREEREGYRLEIVHLMEGLGWTEDLSALPDRLPAEARLKTIESLLEKKTSLDSLLEETLRTLTRAENDLALLQKERDDLPPPPDLPPIEALYERVARLSERSPGLARMEKSIEAEARRLSENVQSLGCPSGEMRDLRAMRAPSDSTVQDFERRFGALFDRESSLRQEIEALEKRERELASKIRRLGGEGSVVSTSKLQEIRDHRDRVFDLLVRRHIAGETEQEELCRAAFPQKASTPLERARHVARAIGDSDRASDALRSHAQEAAEMSLLRREREDCARLREESLARLQAITGEIAPLAADWAALWSPGFVRIGGSGRPEPLPPALRSWQKSREALSLQEEKLVSDRLLLEEAREEEAEIRQEAAALFLRLGLFPAGRKNSGVDRLTAAPLSEIKARLEAVLMEGRELKKRHDSDANLLKERARSVLQKKEDLAEHRKAIDHWERDFREALRGGGFPEGIGETESRARIDALRRLAVVFEELRGLSDRIRKMEDDERVFSHTVHDLWMRAGLSGDPPGSLEGATRLIDLSRKNRDNMVRSKALDERIRELEKEKLRAEKSLRQSQSLLGTLSRDAGASDPEDLARIEEQSREKAALRKEQEDLEGQILSEGEGDSLETILARTEGVNAEALRRGVAEAQEKKSLLVEAFERALSEQAAFTVQTDQRLQGLSVDLEQEAEGVLASMSVRVTDYLRLTAMETVLRRAMDLYRERTQGPLLQEGSRLFETMTGGRYRGLQADFDDRGSPVLRAGRPDGTSLDTESLSDGTLDVLYLSLRLAAVRRHNALAEPLPFLADDLFVNLDDERSRLAFLVLGESAHASQVLFFTHHRHMVDLAREVLPDCQIHEIQES